MITINLPYEEGLKNIINLLPTIQLTIEGGSVAVVYSDSPPAATDVLWVNTTGGANVLNYYDTNIWVSLINGISASSDNTKSGLEAVTNAGGFVTIGLVLDLIQNVPSGVASDGLEVVARNPADGENYKFDFGFSQLYKNVINVGVSGGGDLTVDMSATTGDFIVYDQHAEGTTTIILGNPATTGFDVATDKVRAFYGYGRGTNIYIADALGKGGNVQQVCAAGEICSFMVTAKNGSWNISKVTQGSGGGNVSTNTDNFFTAVNDFASSTVMNGNFSVQGNTGQTLFFERKLTMTGQRIDQLGDPVFDQDATTKIWVESNFSNNQGDVTAAGNNAFTGQNTFPDPTAAQEPVTKAYGDANYLGGGGGGGGFDSLTGEPYFWEDFLDFSYDSGTDVFNAGVVGKLFSDGTPLKINAGGAFGVTQLQSAPITGVFGLYPDSMRSNFTTAELFEMTFRIRRVTSGGSVDNSSTMVFGIINKAEVSAPSTSLADNGYFFFQASGSLRCAVRRNGVNSSSSGNLASFDALNDTWNTFRIVQTKTVGFDTFTTQFYRNGALVHTTPVLPLASLPVGQCVPALGLSLFDFGGNGAKFDVDFIGYKETLTR